jgi:AbiV family abortive infection protein
MSELHRIAQNAKRLASDARLLFDAQRYPSSLALAILSLEESGKYYLLSRGKNPDDVSRTVRQHVPKQLEASWFLVEAAILAFFELLKVRYGYEHKPIAEMTDRQRQWLASNDGIDFAKRLTGGEWPPGAMDWVMERLRADGVPDDYQAVTRGDLNRMKQIGLYVDAGYGEEVEITDTLAEKWLRRAEGMARRATEDGDRQTSGPFGTAPRDDLIGQPRPW